MTRPTIICPVDFSEPSQSALRFAATIAEHFYAGLTLVTVEDPLLAGASTKIYGEGSYERQSREQLQAFFDATFERRAPKVAELRLAIAIGKPSTEILRLASSQRADLIVMSTHGRRGASKAFFGSTTERLLRETAVPVLVTPAGDPGPADLEHLVRGFGGVLAPVDLSSFSLRQVMVAHGLARALNTTLTLLHVVEPFMPGSLRDAVARQIHAERVCRATRKLEALADSCASDSRPETRIADGDAAAEIVAAAAAVGVIVMGLHDNTTLGARMGSVTYRVLCQTESPVLALPPTHKPSDVKPEMFARAGVHTHA